MKLRVGVFILSGCIYDVIALRYFLPRSYPSSALCLKRCTFVPLSVYYIERGDRELMRELSTIYDVSRQLVQESHSWENYCQSG